MAYQKPNLPSVHFPAFEDRLGDLSGQVTSSPHTSGTGTSLRARSPAGWPRIHAQPLLRACRACTSGQSQAFGDRVSTVPTDLQRLHRFEAAAVLNAECAATGVDVLINNAGIMAMPDEATEALVRHPNADQPPVALLAHARGLRAPGACREPARRGTHRESLQHRAQGRQAPQGQVPGGPRWDLGGNSASMLLQGARWVRYGQTKLANAAFTAALHRKLRAANSGVKALVAHPGFATPAPGDDSQVWRHAGPDLRLRAGGVPERRRRRPRYPELRAAPEARCGQFYGPGRTIMATRGPAEPLRWKPSTTTTRRAHCSGTRAVRPSAVISPSAEVAMVTRL